MNMLESTAPVSDARQVLAAAVAHWIERMSKEEMQGLVARAHLEVQVENAALKKRVAQLEADKLKLLYELARNEIKEEDFANFDPNEYTVPVEEMLGNAKRRLGIS